MTTDLDLSAIERAAIRTTLDSLRDVVAMLPSFDWGTQHDHPRESGAVGRASVLRAIEEPRP